MDPGKLHFLKKLWSRTQQMQHTELRMLLLLLPSHQMLQERKGSCWNTAEKEARNGLLPQISCVALPICHYTNETEREARLSGFQEAMFCSYFKGLKFK